MQTILQIVLLCLSIAPVVLSVSAILGLMGILSVGPRELPSKDPINRQMSIAFLLIGLGLFFWQAGNQLLSDIGLGIGLLSLIVYFFSVSKSPQKIPAHIGPAVLDRNAAAHPIQIGPSERKEKEGGIKRGLPVSG